MSSEEKIYPQLEAYLQNAIDGNPELQALRAATEAERARVREVGLLPDPEVTLMYDFNPMMYSSSLGRFSVSAMQMFPWFGTLEARRKLQDSSVNTREAIVFSRHLEISKELKFLWFSIAELRARIQVAKETSVLIRDLETAITSRYETGRSGQADMLRIEMEEARLLNRIRTLEGQLSPLQSRFNELLNRDLSEEVLTDSLVPRSIPLSNTELQNAILTNHPDFDRIEHERSGATQQIRLAELDGRPGLGVGLEVMGRDFGAMSMFPDARESVIGMATLRIPLFRSRYDSQKQQALHSLRALDYRQQQTKNYLLTDLEERIEAIRSGDRMLQLLDNELIPRTRRALTLLKEEYAAGTLRFEELIRLQRELLILELERIETVTEQNRAAAALESLLGSPSSIFFCP